MEKYVSFYLRQEIVECDETTTYGDFLVTIGEKFNLKEKSFYVKGLLKENFEEIFFENDYFEIERSEYDKAKERLNGKDCFSGIKTLQEAEDFLTVYGFKLDKYGRTPIHWAVRDGHINIIKLFLEKNLDNMHMLDYYGRTPLNIAVRDGHINIVKLFLEKNLDNMQMLDCYGRTPLHCATHNGDIEMVKLLLEQKFDNANQEDKEGKTPLHYAAHKGHLEIVELLLERNFDNVHNTDSDGMRPLDYAKSYGHRDIVELISKRAKKI